MYNMYKKGGSDYRTNIKELKNQTTTDSIQKKPDNKFSDLLRGEKND
jgi:hypothetical protein